MQAARIWFQNTTPKTNLSDIKSYLIEMSAEVEETEWSLGRFVVPQLYITRPIPFLIQLNDDEYVVEEAEEFSDYERTPDHFRSQLAQCTARFEIGDVSENSAITDQGIVVVEGWTQFDPAHAQAQPILEYLTTKVGGILEDNVNGTWWHPKGD